MSPYVSRRLRPQEIFLLPWTLRVQRTLAFTSTLYVKCTLVTMHTFLPK